MMRRLPFGLNIFTEELEKRRDGLVLVFFFNFGEHVVIELVVGSFEECCVVNVVEYFDGFFLGEVLSSLLLHPPDGLDSFELLDGVHELVEVLLVHLPDHVDLEEVGDLSGGVGLGEEPLLHELVEFPADEVLGEELGGAGEDGVVADLRQQLVDHLGADLLEVALLLPHVGALVLLRQLVVLLVERPAMLTHPILTCIPSGRGTLPSSP